MIKKILRRLGYIHESELTEDFLCGEIARMVGDPTEYTLEKKQEDLFFKDLSRVEGVQEYLRATMARDMQRDFAATNEQRPIIRGAFARTAYLRSRLSKSGKDAQEVETKLTGLRYG